MPLLLFLKYTRAGASSRYRSFQCLPALEAAGLRFTVSPLFDDAYLAHKYAHGRARIGDVLRAFARRLWAVLTVPHAAVVVVEYELLPSGVRHFTPIFAPFGKVPPAPARV